MSGKKSSTDMKILLGRAHFDASVSAGDISDQLLVVKLQMDLHCHVHSPSPLCVLTSVVVMLSHLSARPLLMVGSAFTLASHSLPQQMYIYNILLYQSGCVCSTSGLCPECHACCCLCACHLFHNVRRCIWYFGQSLELQGYMMQL